MPVSSIIYTISYTTAGQSLFYNIPYYFMSPQDLLVQTIDSSGNVVTYRLNNDYTVFGVTNVVGNYPNGATLQFNSFSLPPNGSTLVITRNTNRSNTVNFINNQPLIAEVLNQVVDKLTLIVQEMTPTGFKGMSAGAPTDSDHVYNQGDWFINSVFVPGGNFGWVCTTGGGPGIWKEFGPISY